MNTIPLDHVCYNNILMTAHLSALGLPKYIIEELGQRDITYVGQLVAMTEDQLFDKIRREDCVLIEEVLEGHFGLKVGIASAHKLSTLRDIKSFFQIDSENQPAKLYRTHPAYGQDIVLRKVIDMPFSKRSKNALEEGGIEYVGQLITKTRTEIAKITGVGISTIQDIDGVLKNEGNLVLNTPCNRNLETIEDIEIYFGLKPEKLPDVERYADTSKNLSINIILPATLGVDYQDESVLSIVRKLCQSAFNNAVIENAKDAGHFSIMRLSDPKLKPYAVPPIRPTDTNFPSGPAIFLTIPLEYPYALTEVFHESVLNIHAVAESFNGATLYSKLKSELEKLAARPV